MKGRVLVVEPDLVEASRLVKVLQGQQYLAHIARRGDDALALLDALRVGAVLVNPNIDVLGVEWFHQRVVERYPDLEPHVIFMTNGEGSENVQAFVEATGNDWIKMPVTAERLDEVLSAHVDGLWTGRAV